MLNPYSTQLARITDIQGEAPNIKRFKLELEKKCEYEPGQIIFLSIPGFGEAPFAPCGPAKLADNPAKLGGEDDSNIIELCIRKAGRVTEKIHSLGVGDKVGIRGPYGKGWLKARHCEPSQPGRSNPVATQRDRHASLRSARDDGGKNLLIVVGGLGLIPLRTLLLNKDKYLPPKTKIQIFYGAKTPEEFLFKNDFDKWREQGIDLKLTIDKQCPGWDGCVGVVTKLFDEYPIVENAQAFLCGPPIMYKFVLEKIKEKNAGLAPEDVINDENIYLSLERRMHCGIGVCQHCAVGSFYTCKDGPVFRYDEIKSVPGAI